MSSYPSELKTGGIVLNQGATTVSVNSDIINIERAKTVGVDLFINNNTDGGNDFVGTVEVEVCNDLTGDTPNWVPITLSSGSTTVAIAATTNNNDFFDLKDVSAKYMQLSISRTSGTATSVRAVVHCKVA